MILTIKPTIWHIEISLPQKSLVDYLPCQPPPPFQLKPGMRLKVPYGNRKLVGILLSIDNQTTCPLNKLKAAESILDDMIALPEPLMKLCHQVAKYYHRSLGDVFGLALPKRLRSTTHSIIHPQINHWMLKLDPIQFEKTPLSKAQRAILETLHQMGGSALIDTLKKSGFSTDCCNRLAKRGLIQKQTRLHILKPFYHNPPQLKEKPEILTQEQHQAVQKITENTDHFFTLLLHGITGSGKTEVYLQAIDYVLKQKKQALVLIPEISLTPQTVQRFQKRFSVPIVVLHSKLSESNRYTGWYEAQSGHAGIIIGTRSAIFTPMPFLGIIIVDEEHDLSYKQHTGIRYSGRDVALFRGQQEKIPVVLGSATPALESYYQAKKGRYAYHVLSTRPGAAQLTDFKIIDIRKDVCESGLSKTAMDHIQKTLSKQQQVLIFLNQRGFSPSILCTLCGHVVSCSNCDAKMTLHFNPAQIQCHHCAFIQAVPTHCTACNNPNMVAKGAGTERIENTLKNCFPEIPTIRIDRDSTQRKDSLNQLLNQIATQKPAILIGTQMLAKGHHFPDVTLVVLTSIDRGFFSTDFRSEEKTAQLLVQVAGRSGRGQEKGLTLIQTYNPSNPILKTLITEGYSAFADQQLMGRHHHAFPPYAYLALFTAESSDYSLLVDQLDQTAHWMRSWIHQLDSRYQSTIKIIGPLASALEKKQNKYRRNILMQSSDRKLIHQLIHVIKPYLYRLPRKKQFQWVIDIDPQDYI